MKIAHFGVFAPSQSGQYETAKELVKAERMQGIDAQFVDYGWGDKPKVRLGLKDEYIETIPLESARDADLLIRHSDIPKNFLKQTGIPCVIALHGRPESSFLSGYRNSGADVFGIIKSELDKKNCIGFLCFWKEYLNFWMDLIPVKKLFHVSAPVDMEKYNPEGKKYKFEDDGYPNIIIVDLWRDDVTPFNVLQAAIQYKRQYNKDARIHVYGIWKNDYRRKFINTYIQSGDVSDCQKFVKGLEFVYRSADIMVTPHVIATRTVREALASGTSIVAGGDCKYTFYNGDPRNWNSFASEINRCWQERKIDKDKAIALNVFLATSNFSLENVGKEMKTVLDSILEG